MSKTKVTFQDLKLDYDEIGKILKSDQVQAICNSYARKECGEGQHIKSFVGFDRCHALIYKNTKRYPG
jgi:hypothetical protein